MPGVVGESAWLRAAGHRRCSDVIEQIGDDAAAPARVDHPVGGQHGAIVEDDAARQGLVAIGAVRWVGGLGRRTAPAEQAGPVRGHLDLRRALRGLARDRSALQVVLDDGSVLGGTLDRVGAEREGLAARVAELEAERPAAARGEGGS